MIDGCYVFTHYVLWCLNLVVSENITRYNTVGGHSSGSLTNQGVKLGPGPSLGIQSWLWGSLCVTESRKQAMMDPPGFETYGQSQLKSKLESSSGSTKWWLVTAKIEIRRKDITQWYKRFPTISVEIDWRSGTTPVASIGAFNHDTVPLEIYDRTVVLVAVLSVNSSEVDNESLKHVFVITEWSYVRGKLL